MGKTLPIADVIVFPALGTEAPKDALPLGEQGSSCAHSAHLFLRNLETCSLVPYRAVRAQDKSPQMLREFPVIGVSLSGPVS